SRPLGYPCRHAGTLWPRLARRVDATAEPECARVSPPNEKRKQMPTPCPAADGSSERRTSFDAPPPMCIDPEKTYTAEMVTSMGDLTILLDPGLAPKTVNSFVFLSRYHYYDGIIFHRIIKDFVCQGGDPTGTGRGGPGYKFEDELPKAGRYEV